MFENYPKIREACGCTIGIITVAAFLGIPAIGQTIGRAILNDWKYRGSFGTEYGVSAMNSLISCTGILGTSLIASAIEQFTCIPLGQLTERVQGRPFNPTYSIACLYGNIILGSVLASMGAGYVDQGLRQVGGPEYHFHTGPVHTFWTTLAVGLPIVWCSTAALLMKFCCCRRAPQVAGAGALNAPLNGGVVVPANQAALFMLFGGGQAPQNGDPAASTAA